MGLDITEFVMAVEERFQIEIPDDVAVTLVNPKTVIDYVYSRVQNNYSREQIAEIIWEILIDETAIDRTRFDENSRFVEDMGLD